MLAAGLMAAGVPPAGALPAAWNEAGAIVIEAGDDRGLLRIETAEGIREARFDLDAIRGGEGELIFLTEGDQEDQAGQLCFRADRLEFAGERFVLGELSVETVSEHGDRIRIRLVNRARSNAPDRRTRRTWIEVGGDLRVEAKDLVLGDVICLGGNIHVDGEVRRNVIVIGGDAQVSSTGRVHGSVAAIAGRASIDRIARIRGDVLSTHQARHRNPRARYDLDWNRADLLDLKGYYNRVDGGWLGLQLTIASADSVLPTFHMWAGRALLRKRWDFDLGLRQRFFEALPVTFGGRFFRKLATDDDWFAPRAETSILALLAAEDYGDYYLEKGGAAFLTLSPLRDHIVGASYRYTELTFLDHYPNLWHLFDAHKQFRPNFSSVPQESLAAGMAAFEAKLGELRIWYEFDWRGRLPGAARGALRGDWRSSLAGGWRGPRHESREWLYLLAEYQTAGGDLEGDLDYERYVADLRRRQPLARIGYLDLRVRYGGSGGNLPLFRKFYLGGSRTIRSLDEKSLMGEQMILGNLEYVPDMLTAVFRPYLFCDVGKTAGHDEGLFDDGAFRSSIGLGLELGGAIRVMVAKSLDDGDADPNPWVTIGDAF